MEHEISLATDKQEYLLAKNFYVVFEAMIDELVGDPRDKIPKGLKDQLDGKRVDHMYEDQNLTNDEQKDRQIGSLKSMLDAKDAIIVDDRTRRRSGLQAVYVCAQCHPVEP